MERMQPAVTLLCERRDLTLGLSQFGMARMRYVIYGAGAIGAAVGARLAQHGYEAILIARGAHLDLEPGWSSRVDGVAEIELGGERAPADGR